MGRDERREQGREQGVRELLCRLLRRLGVELDRSTSVRLNAASIETLERIAEEVVLVKEPDALAESIRQYLD